MIWARYVSDATAARRESLRQYGLALGTAYQLYDDCLDVLGSETAAGKTLGADLAKGKMTLPLLTVRDRAGAKDKNRLRHWLAHWEPAFLPGVVELMVKHEAFAESRAVIQEYLVAARQALLPLPPGDGRSGLAGLTDFLAEQTEALGVVLLEITGMRSGLLHTKTDSGKFVPSPPAPEPPDAAEAPETDDLTLVRRAKTEDMAAYDQLVRRYQERIYATVYHMTSNHEDANDLVQETFVKAFRALKSFKGDSSFYTWIYRIAVNKTINFLKQRKNRVHLSLNDLDFNVENDPDLVALVSENTPRRDLDLLELQEKLNGAMQKLSEHHRMVVTLHDIQGLSHEEIGKIMDCNVGTVRSRLFYARQQLQAHLSDYLK